MSILLSDMSSRGKTENGLVRKWSIFQMRDYVSDGLIIGFGNEFLY